MTTITTRAVKGTPLTIAEVDANFTNLNNDKIETSTKDASGGVAGLTGFALNLKNVANTLTKAARTWTFPDKDGTVALIGDVLPNITNVFSNAAPNNTTNAAGIQAVAPNTNAHLLLIPKGTGGIANYIPITIRPLGSGATSLGYNNTASGSYSAAFGIGNKANGSSSAAFGTENIVSGYSAAAFGTFNVASGDYSTAFGNGSNTGTPNNITQNKISITSGAQDQMSGFTPLQISVGSVGGILSANGIYDDGAYTNANTFCLTANSSAAFDITVVARSDNHTSFAAWKVLGLVSVNATGTATLYGVTVTTISNAPAWSFTSANIIANSNVPDPLATSTAFGGFNITTPASPGATTVSWGATIISTEVTI